MSDGVEPIKGDRANDEPASVYAPLTLYSLLLPKMKMLLLIVMMLMLQLMMTMIMTSG